MRMSEINVKYVEAMVKELDTNNINLAKNLIEMIFDSEILYEHTKTSFNSMFEEKLKEMKAKNSDFEKYYKRMMEFKEDMKSFDSITVTDVMVDGVRV